MKKRILIVSYLFAPENAIGAVRWSKISKYLSQYYDVSVLCAKDVLNKDTTLDEAVSNIKNIYRVMDSGISKKVVKAFNKKKSVRDNYSHLKVDTSNSIKKRIYLFLREVYSCMLTLIGDYEILKRTKKYLKSNLDIINSFDIVISSYGPKCNHDIAFWIVNQSNNSIKWIADFRDGMLSPINLRLYRRFVGIKERKYVKNANAVTVVAKGCVSDNAKRYCNNKLYLIHNGYDKSDFTNNFNNINGIVGNQKLTFTYTGALFTSNDRDASILFEAIRSLIDEGIINYDNIVINYAGPDYNIFFQQASKYMIEKKIVNYGYVSRGTSLKLQADSDLLIHLTSYNNKNIDVLSGKLFEYMMMKKNVVSIVIGKYKDSSVKNIIEATNLGICCEEANIVNDVAALKKFIKEKYEEKMNLGTIKCNINEVEVLKYDYENIAQQFLNICDELMKGDNCSQC